ncbi:MAG: hypothetical protein P8075_21245 [Deltaproteobacteria bacterium]
MIKSESHRLSETDEKGAKREMKKTGAGCPISTFLAFLAFPAFLAIGHSTF